MLFAITCTDKPGNLARRLETRPAHLAWLAERQAALVLVGPLQDADGKPLGSLLVIEAADRAAADSFAAGDPYAKAGLFESVVIRPFRAVFKDGAQL